MKQMITAALLSLAFAATAQAGVIETPADGGADLISFYSPIGQSFTAEDSAIKFAFNFFRMNPSYANNPLRIELRAGDGTGGTSLAAVDFSLPSNGGDWYDADFSSLSLAVGQNYTAVVSSPSGSPFWGIRRTASTYAGGSAYENGNAYPFDFAFRITPVAVSNVPEPGSLALLALGLAGAGAVSRRARRA